MSIRPYTGEYLVSPVPVHLGLNWCTHNCWYCISSDSPVMMADLRTKRGADVRVGDRLLGFAPSADSRYREWTLATVEETFARQAECVRVTLENGESVVCTPEHHFYSGRVSAGMEYSPILRPLAAGRRGGLTGARYFDVRKDLHRIDAAMVPQEPFSPEFIKGYIRGVLRGDGTRTQYGAWRLAMKDREPLARTAAFALLLGWGHFDARPFDGGDGMQQLYFPVASAVAQFMRGDDMGSAEGLLSGLLDAEGTLMASGVYRIAQYPEVNTSTYSLIGRVLSECGFDAVAEPRGWRVRGGAGEQIRVAQVARPSIERKQNPLLGHALKGSKHRVRVVSCEPAGMVEISSFRTSTNNYVSGGWLSRNCFANLNQPDRRADYDELNRTMKNLIARKDDIKHLPTRLLMAGHPVCASNDSDPFAKSNEQQFQSTFDALADLGVRIVFQTRGGDLAEKTLRRSKPTMVYLSFTSDQAATLKAGEPGAPSFDERKALALAAKDAGHHVVIGLNPFYAPWWDDIYGFIDWLEDHGFRHVWFGELHMTYQQQANVRGKAVVQFAAAIEHARKKAKADPAAAMVRRALQGADINVFSGAVSTCGGFWDAYFALGFPFFPTLDWFFGKLREHGKKVAFDFELFDQAMNPHPELRSSAFKEYLSGIGRSLRNVGFDQKANSFRDVHELLWRIDAFPTKLRHDDIFIATHGDSLAEDDSGRLVLVYAPGIDDPDLGRIDIEACDTFLTADI